MKIWVSLFLLFVLVGCNYAYAVNSGDFTMDGTVLTGYWGWECDENGYLLDIDVLEIPNGVTKIGEFAFAGMYNIRKIVLPNTVVEIGDQAFNGCQGLESIVLSENLISIGSEAFVGCSNLTNVKLPNSVSHIGDEAFAFCGENREAFHITVPKNVQSLGWRSIERYYSDTKMYVAHNSVSERYAIENSIPYEYIDDEKLKETNQGYEIVVVLDGQEIKCDEYCFDPKASDTYFGLRAYYNGKVLNTTAKNPEFKFVFNAGEIDNYMCIYDFSIDPKTDYFKGYHKDYWLLQRLDTYTFRYNPNANSKGIVNLVDKNGKVLKNLQVVVRPDGRYVTGKEVGYHAGEYLYTYEVYLPQNVYRFWDSSSTTHEAKRLWYDLQVQATYNRIMSAIPTLNLEAFMQEYGKDLGLRASVALNNGVSVVLDGVSSGASFALRAAITGYLDSFDIVKASLGNDAEDFEKAWRNINNRNQVLYNEAMSGFAAFEGLADEEAVIAQGIIEYLVSSVPKDLEEVHISVSDMTKGISTAKKSIDTFSKVFKMVVKDNLDKQLKVNNLNVSYKSNERWFDTDAVIEQLKKLEVSFVVDENDYDPEWYGKLEEFVDFEASRPVIEKALKDYPNSWESIDEGVDLGEGLVFTEKTHWLLLDRKYGNNGIYERIKQLYRNEVVGKVVKYGGETISAVLGVAKVLDTTQKYELVLNQWEDTLTEQMAEFPVGSSEYEIYEEVLSRLRVGIETSVSNALFAAIKPFVDGELGLKDLPTYVAEALGTSLSLPVQLAKIGLSLTVKDNEGSKGKQWDLDVIYDKYLDAQKNLENAIEKFKENPNEKSFSDIEGCLAIYQLLRLSCITMMDSILTSDADRWSDTIVLSIIDAATLPERFGPAVLNWILTGDTSKFSMAAERVEDKKKMKISAAQTKEQDLETVVRLDAYVFPFNESYGWVVNEDK